MFWPILILIFGGLEVLLALWVFLKDAKSPIHREFALFSIFLAGWTITNAVEVIMNDATRIEFWDRFLFFSALAASYFLFRFTHEYPVHRAKMSLSIPGSILFVAMTIMLFFTDTILAEPLTATLSNRQEWFPIYIISFMLFWIVSVVQLWKSRRVVSQELRQQIDLFLTAVIIGSLIGIISSFIAPFIRSFPNIPQLFAPGAAFIIFLFSVKVLRLAYKQPG